MMRWNREAAMLGIPDLPEEGFKHVGDRKIKPQGGSGGGGGGHTTSTGTQYTSSVPEWLKGEQKEIVARGMALAQSPYTPYTGERISQFTPMQRQAFGAAEQQQVAPQMGFATGLAGLSGMQSFRDPGTAGSFMNPFLEQALAPQLAGVARESAIRGTQQQGEATMRGAFGGSRDAIMRAEREKNLMGQQSDILGRGYAQAFDTAQSQFNAERAAQMQAAGLLGQLGQQQFGQEMDIMGRQREFGDAQQQQIQRILDQQFSDFQAQRDFPYQQIGFASDLIQGRGGSTRTMYQQPTASPLQTAAGLGGIAAGLGGLFAKGGEVKKYANGGITGLLDDQQLAQTAENPGQGPMMQLAAAEEAQQRDMIRSAVPADMPRETDMTEQELIAALQQAIREGNQTKARVIAELIEERKMPESGIAAIASDDIGDMPEGGLIGMAMGGEVQRFQEGGTPRSPYRSRDEILLERQDPMSGGVARALALQQATEEERRRMLTPPPPPEPEAAQAGLGALTIPEVMGMYQQAGYDMEQDQAQQMGFEQAAQAARAERIGADRTALDQMITERGVYGEEREAALKDQIEGLTGKKETAKSMALFQAGLAILSADPRRGAFAAIGEGALQGLGAYKGDVEKLEATREKINERMDRIMDIRRQERMADDKERLALQKEENALQEANIRDTSSMLKGFGSDRRDLAKAVVTQAVSSREQELNRQARAESMRNRSVADLAQMRISLDATIRRLESKTFLEPEEEIELQNARADRAEVMKRLAGRQDIELPSQRGVGGGTLSQADQDLINRYR
jgi:hypothetical protein